MVLKVFFSLKKHFSTPPIKYLKELDSPDKLREFFQKEVNNKDFIENIRLGFFLYRSDPEYPLPSVIPNIQLRFKSVFHQIQNFDLKDVGSLLYILRASKESKINSLFSYEPETLLFRRIDQLLAVDTDAATLSILFRDMALLEKSSKRLESCLIEKMKTVSNEFSLNEIRRILIGTTFKHKEKFNQIEENILKRIKKMNLMIETNKNLADCLKLLAFINKKKDISSILNLFIYAIQLKIQFFTVADIRSVFEYCVLSEKIEKGLLYDSLYQLEQLLNDDLEITENEFSTIVQIINKLYLKDRNLRFRGQLIDKLIEKTFNRFINRKLQLIRTFECFSDLEDLSLSFPKTIEKFLQRFKENQTIGYWKFIYLKMLSKIEPVNSFAFENYGKVLANIMNGSVNIKVKTLIKLNQTRNFLLNPQLKEISDTIVKDLIRPSGLMIEIIHLSTNNSELRQHLSKTDLAKIVKQVLELLDKNLKNNEVFFTVKYSLFFLIKNDEVLRLWKSLMKKIDLRAIDSVVSALITELRPSNLLEPYFFLISSLKANKDLCLAKICSLTSDQFEVIDLLVAFDHIKQQDPIFLINPAFTYSKKCLISQIFQTVAPAEIASYARKAAEILERQKFDLISFKSLIELLTSFSFLPSKQVQNVVKKLKLLENNENFEDYVLKFSEILPVFAFPEFSGFLHVKSSIDAEKLLKRLKAYLKGSHELPGEDLFIQVCVGKAEKGESLSLVVDLMKVLSEKNSHHSFRTRLLLGIHHLVFERVESFPLNFFVQVFNNLLSTGILENQLLEKFEEIIFIQKFTTFAGINLLRNYLVSKRFNNYFSRLCNMIDKDFASIYSLEFQSLLSYQKSLKDSKTVVDYPEEFKSLISRVLNS